MNNVSFTGERAFEDIIECYLLEHGGYECGVNDNWSRELALDRVTLFDFLRATQFEDWDRLKFIHGDEVETRFLRRLWHELDHRGMLDVLRRGVTDYGVHFQLAFFKPASKLNPETQRLYDANRLTVFRQLHYSERNPNDSVDIVLCLNGLPVATIELKNQFTRQTSDHARNQFMTDRDPRDLLFRYKSRTLVHFAIDADTVWMTTKLDKSSTRFLPFNKGYQGGAGNPPGQNGHRTAYMWEDILTKDSLMDILGNFMHLQQEELRFGKNKVKKESLIFPRYHQLEVVRELRETVKREGLGNNYLIQHSAGSGKSNTIGWLAHALSSLHDYQDQNVFDSVIVISDRRVIDRQLQDVIYQFQHKQGVVVNVERDSDQLALALTQGAKIIVTTLQKFSFVSVIENIEQLPARRYAVLIDEAHSSQSGEASDKMKTVLTSLNADDDDEQTLEDAIAQTAEERRAKLPNICFFAFTATPKPKTLTAFGTPGTDGKPYAWHLYSMRQAIEENFILDVLKNYTTYQTFFKLTKRLENDPHFGKKSAQRAIARFLNFHPHNLSQKVTVIVEHFKLYVMSKIGGQAKAMVVTNSREHAVRYKLEVDRYLKEKVRLGDPSYGHIKALVAFSGAVKDDEFGIEYTEAKMNAFGEGELPEKFSGAEYQLLLVAEKYQTGFDQPLLHTMYVDKRLSGVRAVQTLSRLNRVYPGKEDTFVLDFVNERDEIQAAFQPFYEGTTIEEDIDPNQLYDLKTKLEDSRIVTREEVDRFAEIFFQPRSIQFSRRHALLNRAIDPAVDRFRIKEDHEKQEFKHLLAAFIRLYSYLSQVIPFVDVDLEKSYAYARLLMTKLREEGSAARVQFNDEIALEYYRIQKMSEGPIRLEKSVNGELRVAADVGTSGDKETEEALSAIIRVLNDRFGTDFDQGDQLFFEQIEHELYSDHALAQQGRANTIENFRYPFNDKFINKVVERMDQNQEIADKLINEGEFAEAVSELLLERVYKRLHHYGEQQTDQGTEGAESHSE